MNSSLFYLSVFVLCSFFFIPSNAIFEPLEFTGNVVLRGEGCFGTEENCQPIALVMDSVNQRIFFDLGGGGKYWIFRNVSYISLPGGNCTIRRDWNYTSQVVGYSTAFSKDRKDELYIGETRDVGSCGDPVFVDIERSVDRRGRADYHYFNFQQIFPVPPAAPLFCILANGVQKYTSSDFRENRNPFFVLPPDCLRPDIQDYCSVYYPPGNPCDNFYA